MALRGTIAVLVAVAVGACATLPRYEGATPWVQAATAAAEVAPGASPAIQSLPTAGSPPSARAIQPHAYEFRYPFAGGRARVTVFEAPLAAVDVGTLANLGTAAERRNSARIARAWLQTAGTRGAIFGATPFEADGSPAGVVYRDGVVVAAPRAPYWAVLITSDGISLVEQATLESLPRDGSAPLPTTIIGGFYPLVIEGQAVADRFPGVRLRAARVAIGLKLTPPGAPILIVVAVDAAPLFGRPGPTTGELAALLVAMGCNWALNLDGGQSAFLALDVTGRPMVRPRVPLGWRRVGPILFTIKNR